MDLQFLSCLIVIYPTDCSSRAAAEEREQHNRSSVSIVEHSEKNNRR